MLISVVWLWWTGVRPGLVSCAARVPRLVYTQHANIHTAEARDAPWQKLQSHAHIHRRVIQLITVNLLWLYLYVCVCVRERVCIFPSYSLTWEGECWGQIVKCISTEHIVVHSKFDEMLESVIFCILHLGFCSARCVPHQADGRNVRSALLEITFFPWSIGTKLIVMCLTVKWLSVTVSQNVNHTMQKQSI